MDGEPPVRHCHKCYSMAHPAHHKCPKCGADLGKHCPLCGTFRPWSRWTVHCPIEHETVCDRCDPNFHSGGRYDPKQNGLFYAQRADERGSQGDLERALEDWSFAIHAERKENTPGQLASWYVYRAKVHAEMGNIDLAEADFSEAENVCADGGLATSIASEFMHRERAKMYDKLVLAN